MVKLRQVAKKKWVVEEEFNYYSFTIPVGFTTDLKSGPGGNYPKYNDAWVLHDWLYASQQTTRLKADCLLCLSLGELGMDNFMIKVIYKAVRRWGWWAWICDRFRQAKNPEWFILKE